MSSADSAKQAETLTKSQERKRRWEQQRKVDVTYEQYLTLKNREETQSKT